MVFEMNAMDAASDLQEKLAEVAVIQSVGVGEKDGVPAIYVYTTTLRDRDLEAIGSTWEGFPVVLRRVGRITPLAR